MNYSVMLILVFACSTVLSSSIPYSITYGQEQFRTYQDPIGRFTINYPDSWIISPLPEVYRFDENIKEDIAVEFIGEAAGGPSRREG